MPNYMRSRVTMKGIAELPFYDEWGDLDFDKVIPTPKELLQGADKDGFMPLGEGMILRNWRREHWGTWSSSAWLQVVTSNRIVFETAWTPPIKLFQEVSRRYPDRGIFIEWADEVKTNHNVGCAKIINGEVVGRIDFETTSTCERKWEQLWRYGLPKNKYMVKNKARAKK